MKFHESTVVVIPAAGPPKNIWANGEQYQSDLMLPIAGKPAIFWTLQDLISCNIRKVVMVVAKTDNVVEHFVRLVFSHRLEIDFVVPDRMFGVGYSVYCGTNTIDPNAPLLVVLGDTIPRLENEVFNSDESFVHVAEVPDSHRWCMAEVDHGVVERLIDKPESHVQSNLALTGVYFFSEGSKVFRQKVEAYQSTISKIEMSWILEPLVTAKQLKAYQAKTWLDIGNPDHVHEARKLLIKARSFNKLTVDEVRGTIIKRSSYTSKFLNEINYYRLLPEPLKVYFPRLISFNDMPDRLELELEYYAYPTLADLFLFYRFSPAVWHRLFILLQKISHDFTERDCGDGSEFAYEVYLGKNYSRFDEFLKKSPEEARFLCEDREFLLNGVRLPSFRSAWDRSQAHLEKLVDNARLSPVHGDLCFSNILCDPFGGLIKLIDPRGSFGPFGVLGDFRYDIAKLAHSVLGNYDFIVNDLFQIRYQDERNVTIHFPSVDNQEAIQSIFKEIFFKEYIEEDILLATAWLFLSMLPLHADAPVRQIAMAFQGLAILRSLGI